MKILAILTYYYPHWTGLTVHAVKVAEGLASRGHQVTVLTSRHSPELPRDEMINGVRVIRLQPVAQLSRGKVTPAFPYAAGLLIAQHDVVQIHTPLPEAPLVALLCRSLNRPLLMTHHGDVVMPAGAVNQFIQNTAFSVLRSTAKLANAITSYSQDYADHSRLLRPFQNKLHYVYPPVEIPLPDPEETQAWKTGLGLDDRILIGFAGRWVEEKGFDYLLQSLPLIRKVYPQAHLVYAGEQHVVYDHFYEQCLPLVEAQREHITFLGLLTDPQQIANFYHMCDLFTLPSRTDMMALVQVESMLCGTPVVASDIPGARVVVRETGFGKLTLPHNPESLAQAIVDVLNNREQYQPDIAKVRSLFNTQQTMEKYEGLMEKLINVQQTAPQQPLEHNDNVQHDWKTLGTGFFRFVPRSLSRNGTVQAPMNLSEADQAKLEQLLQNEADMAFRRRAVTLINYLDLQDGDTVLDCGCGMGVYLMMMNRLRNIKLYGVDGDVSRLEWAEQEHVQAHLSSVDIHRLPFPDATFDKILMSEVLEHLADDRAALREIYRVLKPGGTLALSVPHANYPFWWDPINKTLEFLDMNPIRSAGPIAGLWSNHWRLYLPEELRDVMACNGFRIDSIEEQTHYSFPFIHFIVYSIGKPLIEYNLLPKSLRDSADRFRGEHNNGSMINPINVGVKLFRQFDGPNEHLRGNENTFVNVVAKATKPL
ncbi:MAG: glycosyltransferase [Chloroflexota bacterium]